MLREQSARARGSIQRRAAAAAALLWALATTGGQTDAATQSSRLADLTGEWELLPEPLLWEFHNLYNARVVQVPDARHPYRMWLFGWADEEGNPGYAGYDAIYHARSADMRRWEVYAGAGEWDATMDSSRWVPVLTAGDAPYDNFHAGDPSVVARRGRYYMAYSSVGVAEAPDALGELQVISCIMAAESSDGIHWMKSAAPILMWPGELTDPWLLSDGAVGQPPTGHMGSYHRPSLLWDGGRWRLWFDYFLPGTFVSMGLAECDGEFLDPSAWRVLSAGEEPLLEDWPNTSVVRLGGRYLAFADPPYYPEEWGGDTRQLTVAESGDGLAWRVRGHLRPQGTDSTHVPEAAVLTVEGKRWLYLLYAWKPPSDPWDYRYKAIRALRRPLIGPGPCYTGLVEPVEVRPWIVR